MIPRIIHQVWLGKVSKIPELYLKWAEDLRTMNPTFQYRFHVDDMGPYRDRFFSPASASNFIRLSVLEREGGIYLDMDVEPLKPLDPLLEYRAFAAEQDPGRLCNAVFGAEPFHPWITWQLQQLARNGDPHDAAWGVYTMSAAPREGVTIIPTHWVYPYHYDDPPENRVPKPDSLLAHWWAGSWTR